LNACARLWAAPALVLVAVCLAGPAAAVEVGSTYQTAAPGNAQVANWNSGWAASGITGWNYVGEINGGASATYLGNGWVLTAGHARRGELQPQRQHLFGNLRLSAVHWLCRRSP
jgi:hypothetical protein